MSNKVIGQFFSGTNVANLLVLATGLNDVGSITAIDPMVGQADMLVALQHRGAHAERLYGIDIDGKAIADAKARLEDSHFFTADAFSKMAVGLYNSQSWDLVITNPPYVRYQALDTFYGRSAVKTIRDCLVETLEALDVAGTKRPYLESAKSYSGLSDLAVPCWILCACLVKPGGKLAMVLPDAWLKREYAVAIRDVLNADFSVDRIIVDENRAWFADAKVKTNLLVATKRNDDSSRPDNSHVHHIGLLKRTANSRSLVGSLTYGNLAGDEAFIEICRTGADYTSELVWARHEDLSSAGQAPLLGSGARAATLHDWGFNVGQGLRTGANGFFYLKEDEDGRVGNDIWEKFVGIKPIDARRLPLVPTLRYQDEIGNAYSIGTRKTKYQLLRIVEPIDIGDTGAKPGASCLKRYIEFCEEHDVVRGRRRQRIPNLSAVRTNGALSNAPGQDRYWYMLPELKDRHLPDLVIPRINGGVVRAYLLPGERQVVADANFSTIWVDGRDPAKKQIALALLNSTYVRVELERICSVLGGGALKCEAVSLRKLALPEPREGLQEKLRRLGEQLAIAESIDLTMHIQNDIDNEIAREMAGGEGATDLQNRWREELDIRLRLRNE